MSDYVSCPTCHGKGMIPLADAEPIKAHAAVVQDEARLLARERDASILQANLDRRMAEAGRRLREIQELAFGKTAPGDSEAAS